METQQAKVIKLAREKGVIRPRDLEAIGVSRSYVHYLAKRGILVLAARGLYHLRDLDVTEAHSLVEATQAQAKGIVCLISALSFHQIGTQLPGHVWLAVPFDARITKSPPVPLRIIYMRSSQAYEAGIEYHQIEGVAVPIYSVAKTIADCFKFRNKVGLDVALEALREVLREKRCTRDEIRLHARINRIERVMRPYLESMSQ